MHLFYRSVKHYALENVLDFLNEVIYPSLISSFLLLLPSLSLSQPCICLSHQILSSTIQITFFRTPSLLKLYLIKCFLLACTKDQGAIVTLTAWAFGSHFEILRQRFLM